VGVYLQGRWHTLLLRASTTPGPQAALDAERLQRSALELVLGIGDPRTDKRIDFVGGFMADPSVDIRYRAGAFSDQPRRLIELLDLRR